MWRKAHNTKLITNKLFILVAGTLLVIIFLEGGLLGFLKFIPEQKKASLQKHAEEILEKCSSARYKPSCYDKQIPKLMDKISMEEAFQVTSLIQEKDGSYRYCHVLGHALSAKEVSKDFTNWKDVVSRCPSGMCSNGCIHGAFQERFRVESLPDAQIKELKPELENACEERKNWNPTRLEQASCYHALGHLVMYITDANIDNSIALCEAIAIKEDGRNLSQLCFDGAFMQIFQPLEPEDFALVKGKVPLRENLSSFCGQFSGKKRSACISESWPLFREEIKKPEGVTALCSKLNDDGVQEKRCYNALFYVVTPQLEFSEERIKNFCTGFPKMLQGQCFANASSRMIETDWKMIPKAVSLCSVASAFGLGEACYSELLKYSTYNFHAGSEEFYRLCNSLPESWKERCLARGKN